MFKHAIFCLKLFISTAVMISSGCVRMPSTGGTARTETLKIDRVFFAQQHVQEPDSPHFKLVGNRDTLIKVQVYSKTQTPSPSVAARLEIDGVTREIALRGPERLPRPYTGDPVLMPQSYADSFTAMIPREWIRKGLKVTVELRDYNYLGLDADDTDYTGSVAGDRIRVMDQKIFDALNIGAPTDLVLQVFDIHYFGLGTDADLPQGWETELKAKLPVANLTVHRVRHVMFNEIVMPPLLGGPSAKYSSPEDFKARNGKAYDGEQGIALRWGSALKAAAGGYRFWRPYHINICGVPAGGQGGGFRSCGSIHRHGVIIHELGHAFGLPHWNRNKDYPYKSTMYGRTPGTPASANAGPVWAFDVGRGEFISPGQEVKGEFVWKKDPMQGGGKSGLVNYMFKHFSDYSVNRMQNFFETRGVYWNETLGQYAKWNQASGAYDLVMENNGLDLPVERDVEVISILASANAAVPDANIVYPPIGPYTAGLIRRFDANSPKDRQAARELGYTDKTCSVTLRVTQGGKVSNYLLKVFVSPDDDPLKAFNVTAINLPARDGEITAVDLLYTPEVISRGLNADCQLLYRWDKERTPPQISMHN